MNETGAIWLASYPKSGNTWLRCLLDAYRRNGLLDINDIQGSSSDGGAILYQAVASQLLGGLGYKGQMLLRPAALMHLIARHTPPVRIKTHSINVQPPGLPPLIPKEITYKAIYVVRDPRSVVLSLCRFFGMPIDAAVECMANKDWVIGGNDDFAYQTISSWSNHVATWVGEKEFPVHVVRYEDLQTDAVKELTEVLEFLEEDVDPARVKLAVEAADITRCRKQEEDKGFSENGKSSGMKFFQGTSNWQDDLGPRWARQIEKDHVNGMQLLGYLESNVLELSKKDGEFA